MSLASFCQSRAVSEFHYVGLYCVWHNVIGTEMISDIEFEMKLHMYLP